MLAYSSQDTIDAAHAVRRRLERDLHDGAQRQLVLLSVTLGRIERRTATGDPVAGLVAEARATLARALQELRDLARGVCPVALEQEGLNGALRRVAQRTSLPTRVECNTEARYRRDLEVAVYFCCLEALQNATKHAGEQSSVVIRIHHAADALCFEVCDDGRGCDPGETVVGMGMCTMTDRIHAHGGTLIVKSALGAGTRVIGQVPVTSLERVDDRPTHTLTAACVG